MTRIQELLREIKERADRATPKTYGRTEYVAGEKKVRKLAYAIYHGEEREGYFGKEPIAWIISHGDACLFGEARTDIPKLVKALEVALKSLVDDAYEERLLAVEEIETILEG